MRGGASSYWLAALAVLATVAVLFALIGTPDVVTYAPRSAGATSAQSSTGDGKLPSVGNLLDGLKAKLEDDPANGDLWLLLAKSYHHLGHVAEAADAYANAVANGSSEPEFEQLLSSGEHADSVADAPAIRGRVSLAESARGSVGPDASVFITAKSSDGSPMPLAVIRRTVADLPFDFELNDDQSMVRGRGLSSVSEVIVSAKVSSTGDALRSDPGMETSLGPISIHSTDLLDITIGSSQSQAN
ncbi:MAG: hypothetical protein OEX13_02570 [Gammaproteobacteria bacterium]|nr:hypothetical protein [Gammaproteobacteria bacterium]